MSRFSFLLAIALLTPLWLGAQNQPTADKPVIGTQADMPRYTYDLPTETASALLTDSEAFSQVAEQVKGDLEDLLSGYVIEDKSTLRDANGFEVDSYLPGGERMEFSGTSMAAPNVTNLAAKLFALDPDLSAVEVRSLIVDAAETTEDGRRFLMNPKKSVETLRQRMEH